MLRSILRRLRWRAFVREMRARRLDTDGGGRVRGRWRDQVSEPALCFVTVDRLPICAACLDGEGGECHTPGCVMWLNRAPDLPLRTTLTRDYGAQIHDPAKSGTAGDGGTRP